jgi:hypothetical protein
MLTISAYIGGTLAISTVEKYMVNPNDDIFVDNSIEKSGDIKQDACCGHTDTTPPTIKLSSPANNSFNLGGTTLRISIIDDNPFDENKATEVLYRWNNDQSNTSLEESDEDYIYTLDLPTNLGAYLLYVYAGDSSGNWGSAVFRFTVVSSNTNPPEITFIAPSTSNESLSGIYEFRVSVTDDLGLIEVRGQIDRRASQPMNYDDYSDEYYFSYNVSTLAIGTHWFNVTAVDVDPNQHTVIKGIDFFILLGEEGSGVGNPSEWSVSNSDLPENITNADLTAYKAEKGDIYFMVAVKDDNGISSVDFTVYALDEYDPSTGDPDISNARKELSISLDQSGTEEDWETYEYTWDSTASVDSYYLCEFEIQDADEIAHQLYIRIILETDNVPDQPSSVDIGGAPGFELEMVLLAFSTWIIFGVFIKRKYSKKNP